MLEHNNPESSNSHWASPVVPILWENNSLRVCADLRRVHQQGRCIAFTSIYDCIDQVGCPIVNLTSVVDFAFYYMSVCTPWT